MRSLTGCVALLVIVGLAGCGPNVRANIKKKQGEAQKSGAAATQATPGTPSTTPATR
jgi:hypothetical protein